MLTTDDMFEASLIHASSERQFLVVSGQPGDGSFTQAQTLMGKGGAAPVLLDFGVATSPVEIAQAFQAARDLRADVLASGFDPSPKDCKAAIVQGLEGTAADGRKAVLSVKGDFDASLFGNAHFFVALSLPDVGSALAKKRISHDFGGLPSASAAPKA